VDGPDACLSSVVGPRHTMFAIPFRSFVSLINKYDCDGVMR